MSAPDFEHVASDALSNASLSSCSLTSGKAISAFPSMYVSSAPLKMIPLFSCGESCVDLLAWLIPIQKLGMASILPCLTPSSICLHKWAVA